MSFLTIPWTAPYSMGVMPVDSSEVLDTPLTVPWTAKQSPYVLPYDATDLTLKPRPDEPPVEPPVIVNPIDGPAPAPPGAIGIGGVAPPAPVPGQVRPASPPRVTVQSRVNPRNYRAKGIKVRVTVPERAQALVHVEARMRKTLARRRTKTTLRRLTYKRSVRLKSGTTTLTLRPTSTGKRVIGTRSRVRASVVVAVRYRDGRRATARRTVRIAPPTTTKKAG